jgi:hypothetical protein
MEIPVTDANGPGISIDVPGDALSIDVGTAMSAAPPRFADVADLATKEPGVWSGLADYVLDNDTTLLDPAFGALELASLIEFTGPTISFGPSGLEFDKPATVEVPLSLVELPAGTEPIVLHGSDNRWEVIGGVTVDAAQGVLRYEVNHFSTSFIGRIVRNMVANPTASPTIEQYHNALQTLSAGRVSG